jgi:PAS domain S-box-containing protein
VTGSDSGSPQALIFAPHGRDAVIAGALLQRAGVPAATCRTYAEFEGALDDQICFVVVTEEALRLSNLRAVTERLAAQPAWSDLPFVILTQGGGGAHERDSITGQLSEVLGNVTFLERPFHPITFVSVARTAMKGRQRQFEARLRIAELHESEARLRTALLAGRLGTWELDVARGTLTASPPFKALFGYPSRATLSYSDIIASIHPDDRRRVQETIQRTIEVGGDFALDHRTSGPDRIIRWAEIRARLVKDPATGKARLVGVSSDITERKRAEETLQRLNETLEERVTQRARELEQAHATVLAEIAQRQRAEDQLRQAQKVELIGQLTGGVAHDFNNLLTAVIGNLELVRKHLPSDPRLTRLVEGALQGAQRGASLTQRLLAFARRQDLKVEPRNLVELIRGMANLIERSAGVQVETRFDLPARVPPVLVDANQIELAILNLVVNARDAMPEGGTIAIKLEEAEAPRGSDLAPGPYVRLMVSDTGQGMDPDTLRRATEPFFSTKELGKGTGLGLSMIHGLALQLNGGLRLASAVGRGTTAELWLPVTSETIEAAKAATAIERSDLVTPKMTILVVDDDTLIAAGTVDMLEDLGHKVIESHSGDDALAILKSGRPIDLLITDYAMPKMNGTQLAAAVRELNPRLPILLATGYAELPAASSTDLPRIGKPYMQAQLAAKISSILASVAA